MNNCPHSEKIDAYGNVQLMANPKLKYQKDAIISNGTFSGKIYMGYLCERKVALKELSMHEKISLQREIEILSRIDHFNIARFYCAFEASQKNFLITDFFSKPLTDFPKMNNCDKKRMMSQLTDAVAYLQKMKIVHLQIIPGNLFVAKTGELQDFNIKLTNFSRAVEMQGALMHFAYDTTWTCYAAPEIVGQSIFSLKSDIWSLACIFLYFFKGSSMIENFKYENQMNKVAARINQLIPDDSTRSILLKDLIRKMLKFRPHQRLDIEEVQEHPFFWSGKESTDFIISVSKMMERNKERDNEFRAEIIKGSQRIIYENWVNRLEEELVQELRMIQKSHNSRASGSLDPKNIVSLITKIRNIASHAQTETITKFMGSNPESFINYWNTKFPKLMAHLYNAHMRYENKENNED